jgi:tetratricopeptide (TPR) repeat protein
MRKRDCEGAYYLLLRSLFSAGRYQQVAEVAEEALEASGTDYNVYVPILNALGALGKADAARNVRLRLIQALESHLREVPEDARARILRAGMAAQEGHRRAVRGRVWRWCGERRRALQRRPPSPISEGRRSARRAEEGLDAVGDAE